MAIWDCYESDDLLVALHALKGFLDANTSVRMIEHLLSSAFDSRVAFAQLKLVIIDSLSAPFNANLVPALSAQIVSDHEKSNKHRNGIGNSANKRQRKTYFTQDPKQEASYNITRTLMSGLLKDTLMAVTSRNVAVSLNPVVAHVEN